MVHITKETIARLKAGKKAIIDSPVDDNTTAHLVLSPKGEQGTLIRGYLTSLNPKSRITAVREKSKTSLLHEPLPYDIRDLQTA